MASARIVSRVLAPTTLNRLAVLGNGQGPVRHFFYRNPRNLPDVFVGSTSNLFRDLEREFDRMQRQFDNVFRGNTSGNQNRSLTETSRGGNNGTSLAADMIVTEADGSRKFQLAFDMRGFEPEEVKIKTQNGSLIVSAKKEKKVG